MISLKISMILELLSYLQVEKDKNRKSWLFAIMEKNPFSVQ